MTAHEIHALAGAYAVDALEELERARFEAHLAVCTECRAEVSSLQDATLLLSHLSSVAPPAALRATILNDIKKVRPIPPAVVKLDRHRPRPRRWNNLLAAAAVLGVLGGTAVAVDQVREDSTSVPGLSVADRVLTAVDVEHYDVEFVSGASATVSRSVSEGRAVLVARDMKAAPRDQVYQLWLLKDGRMVPAGVMTGGGQLSTVVLEGDANEATGVGITVEPKGGSEEPSGDPIAEFDFEQKST